jgi:hypothetical protein
MRNFFIIYGTLVCVLFSFSSYKGIPFFDSLDSSKWKPKGLQKSESTARGYGGHRRFYHK